MQNLKKNWVVVWKMKWKNGQISTGGLESVKIGTLMGSFVQIRKCVSFKFTKDLCVMKLKNDARIEKELTCRFNIGKGIWRILTRALESFKSSHFNGLLPTKVYNFQAKKV